jgi:hypothetical protein
MFKKSFKKNGTLYNFEVLYVTGEKTQEREELYCIVLKKLKLL